MDFITSPEFLTGVGLPILVNVARAYLPMQYIPLLDVVLGNIKHCRNKGR